MDFYILLTFVFFVNQETVQSITGAAGSVTTSQKVITNYTIMSSVDSSILKQQQTRSPSQSIRNTLFDSSAAEQVEQKTMTFQSMQRASTSAINVKLTTSFVSPETSQHDYSSTIPSKMQSSCISSVPLSSSYRSITFSTNTNMLSVTKNFMSGVTRTYRDTMSNLSTESIMSSVRIRLDSSSIKMKSTLKTLLTTSYLTSVSVRISINKLVTSTEAMTSPLSSRTASISKQTQVSTFTTLASESERSFSTAMFTAFPTTSVTIEATSRYQKLKTSSYNQTLKISTLRTVSASDLQQTIRATLSTSFASFSSSVSAISTPLLLSATSHVDVTTSTKIAKDILSTFSSAFPSVSSHTPDIVITRRKTPEDNSQYSTGEKVGIGIAVCAGLILLGVIAWFVRAKKKGSKHYKLYYDDSCQIPGFTDYGGTVQLSDLGTSEYENIDASHYERENQLYDLTESQTAKNGYANKNLIWNDNI